MELTHFPNFGATYLRFGVCTQEFVWNPYLEDCTVILTPRGGKAQEMTFNVIFFSFFKLPDAEIYCATQYAFAKTEAPASGF